MTASRSHNKILVVDASAIVLERVKALLRELDGIETIATATGFSGAVEILANDPQDVVLLELTLHDKSGFELLAYIKNNYPNTKTIILSNLSGEFYRNKCKELGADFFIDKSSEFEKITKVILEDQPVVYQMN